MEVKDIWIILIGLAGWSWGVFQFFLKRKYQQKDKLTDKRFEAYSAYMKKSDELMNNLRNDPDMIYGISSEFVEVALRGDSEEINSALLSFMEKLKGFVKTASEPLMIIRNELNSLRIICSKDLEEQIEKYDFLVTDFNNQIQKTLSIINTNDSNQMTRELETFVQDERWQMFKDLNKEIINLMRKELGSD